MAFYIKFLRSKRTMLEPTLFHFMLQDHNNQIEAYFLHDRSLFRIPHL